MNRPREAELGDGSKGRGTRGRWIRKAGGELTKAARERLRA